jgi:hypothetical protein
MTHDLALPARRRFATTLLAMAVLLLTACSSGAPPAAPKSIGFKRYQPIMMNVSKIDVLEEYRAPMRNPNVEHLLPVSPAEAMQTWVKDRLRVASTEKSMQVIIKDASVISTPLPKPEGVAGIVNLGNDRRYDARLNVEMRIYGDGAMSEASIEVSATRTINVNERVSVHEREAIFRRMIFYLMETMNAALEKNMFQYFGNHIIF